MQKIILLWIIVLMTGCQSIRVFEAEQQVVDLGQGVFFPLFEPASYGRSVTFTQLAEIQSKQGNHELIFVVQILPTAITIVGLLPNGTRVFSAIYDGETVKSKGYSQLVENLNPKYLIADLQLSLWPHAELMEQWFTKQACYASNRCEFQQTPSGLERSIVVEGKKLITIQYSAEIESTKTIQLDNSLRGYKILLEIVD